MSDYPYPELLPQLQIHATPTTYVQSRWNANIVDLVYYPKKYARYWHLLPQYLFAICPVCGQRFSEPGDTYWLEGWGTSLSWDRTLYHLPDSFFTPRPYCPHFLGIHRFTNLHGVQPTELEMLANYSGEVPYVSTWYLPDDIPSYIVLHGLPICRIEQDRFVPRYTAFCLSYFSADKTAVLARNRDREAAWAAGETEYYASAPFPPPARITPANAPFFDLAAWAAAGRLGWLDLSDTANPLRIGVGAELPAYYRHIVGDPLGGDWWCKDHEPLPPDAPAPLPPPPPGAWEQFFRRFR